MTLLANVIWFLLGGWLLFIAYAISAIVFFPFFIPLFRLALYSAWPFGRGVVSQSQLTKYRELTGKSLPVSDLSSFATGASTILNVLWMLTFGWVLALAHIFSAFLNLLLFWLILTIPNIAGNWKLIPVAFAPFNKVIVPSLISDEVKNALVRAKHGI
jgi:uncharacterized membrane protein YccF (DUF307 family)